MTLTINALFDSNNADWPKGSQARNKELFGRAYCHNNGPFEQVCVRLAQAFSVVVYLPGNCMMAAAEVAKQHSGNWNWEELGRAAEDSQTIADAWFASTRMLQRINDFLSWVQPAPPALIFHNLQLLTDDRGSLYPGDGAKTALYYLTETARSGRVLGLSDIRAGELPGPIRQVFDEEIWLKEIEPARFFSLIPQKLGRLLAGDSDKVLVSSAKMIASRLRWTDPIRAVAIMDGVAATSDTGSDFLKAILAQIRDTGKSVEFVDPRNLPEIDINEKGEPTGYEEDVTTLLKTSIIEPYKQWAQFTGEEEILNSLLQRLPPGLILWGPPGTGKTRLARWIAQSIDLPVRLVGAADLKRADWGLTEQLVRQLFRSARQAAPCIVVLDDADDLLPDRESLQGGLASAERGVVNAFLQELEGWQGRLEGVLLILTTNRYGFLDAAARERLHIHCRIPFPLDKKQVGEIVEAVAKSYALALPEETKRKLEDFFLQRPVPVIADSVDLSNPDERRKQKENLYSHRQIAAAMRLLIPQTGNSVTEADVNRMKRHLERQHGDLSVESGR